MEIKQIHTNHRERMKDLFIKNGFSGFSEVQKLEFMLFFAIPQKDVNPIAHALLNEFGNIKNVLSADYHDLIRVKGVGRHTALLLKTFKAVNLENNNNAYKFKLSNTEDMKAYCYQLLCNADNEEFYAICLDNANNIIYQKKLAVGSATKINIQIQDITRFAMQHRATKLIIAHNHPCGTLKYSNDDLHFTYNLIFSCALNGINLLDHVLVTSNATLSLNEQRYIEAMYNKILDTLNIKRSISVDPSCPYEEFKTCNPANEIPVLDFLYDISL